MGFPVSKTILMFMALQSVWITLATERAYAASHPTVVMYDGREVTLNSGFREPDGPAESFMSTNGPSDSEALPVAQVSNMFSHLLLKDGVRLFRARPLELTPLCKVHGKYCHVEAETAGRLFQRIDSREKAQELVRFFQYGYVVESLEDYRNFVKECRAIDPRWVNDGEPPVVGVKAETWQSRPDLFLVRALAYEFRTKRVVSLDYFVDDEGHVTPAKRVTCVEGPVPLLLAHAQQRDGFYLGEPQYDLLVKKYLAAGMNK
jgi:hypothetical protein